MSVKVSIKWGKQKYDDVLLDTTQPPLVFKMQLFSLTGVLPERQTVMTKAGTLKDDTDWAKLGLKDGYTFMLMGTADAVTIEPPKTTVFIEDMTAKQLSGAEDAPPGLENLGNTCYMNATLQVMRAIPELDQALNKLTPSRSTDASTTISDGMRRLFQELKTASGTVTPFMFLQFGEMRNGQPMQQDAEECWSQLVTNLSQRLREPAGRSFVEQFFNIEFVTTWVNTETEAEPPTTTRDIQTKLQCIITKDVNYLYQGVREALKEEVEKQSEVLGRAALYRKTSKIARLPSYLTVNFVRFFWRRDTSKKAKILRKVKFPVVLDVYDFCTDELKAQLDPLRAKFREFDDKQAEKRALEKRRKHRAAEDASGAPMAVDAAPTASAPAASASAAASGAAGASADEQGGDDAHRAGLTGYNLKALAPVTGENRSGLYELTAVLTHIGRSSDSGHYMAWVRAEGDKWWKFDDSNVSPVTTEDILKLDGGGDWHMAYVCLYRERTLPAEAAAPTAAASTAASAASSVSDAPAV